MIKNQSILEKLERFEEKMIGVEILKTKEAYGYNYADLPEILNIVHPILKDLGIGYYHQNSFIESLGKNTLKTVIYDKDNKDSYIDSITIIDGDAKLAKMNKFMVEGSAITYFRRYHLTTLLKITTDEDSDAGGKRPTKQKPGRSVEAQSSNDNDVDFISIFENMIKNKDKEKVEKTFALYKAQMDNDIIKKVEKMIQNNYE